MKTDEQLKREIEIQRKKAVPSNTLTTQVELLLLRDLDKYISEKIADQLTQFLDEPKERDWVSQTPSGFEEDIEEARKQVKSTLHTLQINLDVYFCYKAEQWIRNWLKEYEPS